MTRLVLDCNVLIAAGWSDGTCHRVVHEIIRNHIPIVSSKIIEEYSRVIPFEGNQEAKCPQQPRAIGGDLFEV
ncbi:hypothetical protein EPICR_30326 [Candidatus Desulfarcum epimagneticum]|uniref:PIN domain-containing protein n=1 Tax=uncultured Desulfobacteraceae bacterium TaxID=218296 RepID=A0A484HGK2_9BACT|nr:hypothetical protein EPICR_30326 [uncultured Desulfobacteraceae bacterium]